MNKFVTSLVTVPILVGGLVSLLTYVDDHINTLTSNPAPTGNSSSQSYLVSQSTANAGNILPEHALIVDNNSTKLQALAEYQKKKEVVIRHYQLEDPRATPASL